MKYKCYYLVFESVWIFTLVTAITFWFPQAPSWPMFFAGLFASIYKEKCLIEILAHSISGLAVAYIYHYGSHALYDKYTMTSSLLLPLLPALAVILFGCLFAPKIFGMTSFAFFSIICAAPEGFTMPFAVFGVLLIGGSLNIIGSKWVEKRMDSFIHKER